MSYTIGMRGIRKIWVDNVGALKPLEQDMEYFLAFGWDASRPEALVHRVHDYLTAWFNEQFSGNFGEECARIYEGYAQITNVCKVEHLTRDVFSQTAYGDEAGRRINRLQELYTRVCRVHDALPAAVADGADMTARAAMIVARYANDKGQTAVAEAYMNAADSFVETAKSFGAPESASGVLEALSTSFWYLIDGSISKGLAFGKIVNELWKTHPEDFHVLLITADKYLHSPGIAGGNKKKGLELYQLAEVIAQEEGCAVWDQFSIYAGLAAGYEKNKEDELAYEYALLAQEIYTADPSVNEIISSWEG